MNKTLETGPAPKPAGMNGFGLFSLDETLVREFYAAALEVAAEALYAIQSDKAFAFAHKEKVKGVVEGLDYALFCLECDSFNGTVGSDHCHFSGYAQYLANAAEALGELKSLYTFEEWDAVSWASFQEPARARALAMRPDDSLWKEAVYIARTVKPRRDGWFDEDGYHPRFGASVYERSSATKRAALDHRQEDRILPLEPPDADHVAICLRAGGFAGEIKVVECTWNPLERHTCCGWVLELDVNEEEAERDRLMDAWYETPENARGPKPAYVIDRVREALRGGCCPKLIYSEFDSEDKEAGTPERHYIAIHHVRKEG